MTPDPLFLGRGGEGERGRRGKGGTGMDRGGREGMGWG